MPLHPDFQAIYDNFIKQYGDEKGKDIYYAYLHNENLDDTKSLASQKDYSVDQWYDGEFTREQYDKYPELIDRIEVYNNPSSHKTDCGCGSCQMIVTGKLNS